MIDKILSNCPLHPLEIYQAHLMAINGIAFTQREIDVLSCLLHTGPRSRKHIATLLSIDVKTVNLHVSNASNKLIGYSNIDRLISTLHDSGKLDSLKAYYLALLIENLFKKHIKEEISRLILKNDTPNCLFVYWQKKPLFLECLKNDLIHIGVNVTVKCRKDVPSVNELLEEGNPNSYSLYFLPEHLAKELQRFETNQAIGQIPHTKAFFLPKSMNPSAHSQHPFPITIINPSLWTSYYESVFAILKDIMPNLDMDESFSRFQKEASSLHSSLMSFPSQRPNAISSDSEDSGLSTPQTAQTPKNRRAYRAITGILTIGIISLWFFINDNPTIHHNTTGSAIRSDLIIPVKPTLLNRSDLLIKLDSLFEKPSRDIQTIALVGVGGTGKTVLARQYARSQNAQVIWEINAQTESSLRNSFENLGYVLAKTEAEKKTYQNIQYIKDITQREKAIMQWVKDHLKLVPNWLLIFDNVESFSAIKNDFPTDSEVWGKGWVIITTNDNNIQNNQLINYTLPINELTQEEKLQLFMNIMQGEQGNFSSPAQLEDARQFLKFIPSYPLDISTAAYYLKSTRISYEQYLAYVKDHDMPFEAMQKRILQDASDYKGTRYQITTLSIKRLIDEQENYKELLLFVSLLESQDIPRSLLDTFQNSVIVDKFIYDLKKFSLITQESSVQRKPYFSIHRSIQADSLTYLSQKSKVDMDDRILQKIVDTLESSTDKAIADEEDLLNMKNHCEAMFRHISLFPDSAKVSLRCIMSMFYCYFNNFEQSKELLEQNLSFLNDNNNANSPIFAKTYAYLGMVNRILGNYAKASDYLQKSLGLYRQLPSANDIRIGWVLIQLGMVFQEQCDYKTAKNFFEEGLKLCKQHFPENHPEIARILVNLAIVQKNQGNYELAKDLLSQSLGIYKGKFSKDHPRVAWILGHLGAIEEENGNYAKAKALLEESIQIHKASSTENHVHMVWFLANLGNVYISLNNPEKAISLLEKSLILLNNIAYDPKEVARILSQLAKANMQIGQNEKARDYIEKSLQIFNQQGNLNSINYANALKLSEEIQEKMKR